MKITLGEAAGISLLGFAIVFSVLVILMCDFDSVRSIQGGKPENGAGSGGSGFRRFCPRRFCARTGLLR